MSGGGGGIIIIKSLMENPSTTADDKDCLRGIYERMQKEGKCSAKDARKASKIFERVVMGG